MPIAALPTQTVRAIGSSQALTDSSSLVKELLDNAIDASATAIAVEISTNALDDLRVKDNGRGISPDDRPLICQRHCTSKIRDLDELRTIGGRSLGFRGVALASAAEMSGRLTIATRIEGEETASEMRFDRQGRIVSERRTSLPMGTTVRVENFLEALPVRRHAVEKFTSKTLAKIKKTLQAYALARPRLRLSLKVVKAKDEKANWKYPINAGNSKVETNSFSAAVDIMGKKLTNQCQWTRSVWCSSGQRIDSTSEVSEVENDQACNYTFEAVLAKQDSDTSIISNIGQYLSVDSRPVSCTRGALKKITSIYKSQLRSASVTSADAKITDPFLYMNIICPRGSYDANVEPAKDDVLFTDADCIVSLVGKFFGSVYGELKSGPTHAAGPEAPPKTSGIALMLARKHSPSRLKSLVPRPPLDRSSWDPQSHSRSTFKLQQPSDTPVPEIFPHEARTSTPSKAELKVCAKGKAAVAAVNDPGKRFNGHPFATKSAQDDVDSRAVSNEKVSTWRESMYDEDEDDDVDEFPDSPARPTPSETLEEEANLRSIQVSNPWAFAKLNAPVCAHGSQRHHAVEADGNNQLPTPRRQAGDAGEFSEPFSDEGHHASLSASGLPTPRRSQPQDLLQPASSPLASFPFPLRARGKGKADVTTKDLSPSNRESNGRGALDAWVQRSSISHQKEYELPDEDQLSGNLMSPPNVPIAGPFVSARTLPRGTPLSDIPDISERPRRKAVPRRQQQQFSSDHSQFAPVNDLEKVWFDTGDKPKRKQSHQVRQRQRHPEPPILRDDEDDVPIVSPPAKTQDPPIHPDLAITLDYEARKHLATQQHRESLRRQTAKTLAQNSTIPTTSPHKNRQQAAIAALHTSADPPPLSSDPSHFSTNDPRAHLIRTAHLSETEHQKAPTHGKFKRTKTSLLPFETIKSTNYTGNLIQPIDTKRLNFTALLNSSADDFIRTGIISSAFSTQTAVQIKAWEETLKEMVKTQYRIEGMAAEEEMEGQLECDLAGILSQHDAMEG